MGEGERFGVELKATLGMRMVKGVPDNGMAKMHHVYP